jgi:hypothetical protein
VNGDTVNSVWKWISMVAVGIIIGAAPSYVSLEIDQYNAMTRKDVDTEIQQLSAPIVQNISDLKEEVNILSGEVREEIKLKGGN